MCLVDSTMMIHKLTLIHVAPLNLLIAALQLIYGKPGYNNNSATAISAGDRGRKFY
jgi:hypothetical protein